MQILDTTREAIDLALLLERENIDVSTTVSKILENVRANGDEAVCEYSRKFDSVDTGDAPRIMNRKELEQYCRNTALEMLSTEQIAAIEVAVANVSWCASKSIPQSWTDIARDGQLVGETFNVFDRVACYIPQGSFPLVSTAIHTAAIANTCGVKEIVMVTSPSNNDLNAAVAYAAMLSGVTEIVFAGGAQGIAAVAYGTETIERVDFICGPGNMYVAQAKRQLFGFVGIDMVAGPSEVFVIADETADPYSIACDLVAQAEHGSGFEASVLLTDSQTLVDSVMPELEKIKEKIVDNPGFSQVWENTFFLVLTKNINQAIELTNLCAPEHVEVQTKDADGDAKKITKAGAVFVGGYSAEPLGDFVAGPSHVLPTNSSARFASGLSAASFFRRTSVLDFTKESYERLAPHANEFAQMEGLTGHGLSSLARMSGSDPDNASNKKRNEK